MCSRGVHSGTLVGPGIQLKSRALIFDVLLDHSGVKQETAKLRTATEARPLVVLSREKMVMPDIEIMCAECSTAFPFTEREQDYYKERNLSHPKRCKPCRDARRSNFGGPKGAGGDRQRFEITCDQCGKTDSVPFKPSSGRPVLCGESFSASRSAPRA